MGVNPLHIIYGVIGLFVVGYLWNCETTKAAQAKAVIVAELAKERAEKETKRLLGVKEKADEENKDLRGKLAVSDKRLRDERARRSRVPPAPTGSKRPDLAAFDRAELERAMAYLDERGSDIARKGAEATVDLDTAKEWSSNVLRQHPPQ